MIPNCLNLMPNFSPEAREAFAEAGADIQTGLISLIIPATLFYFALLALVKNNLRLFEILDWLAIIAFWISGNVVVLKCSVARSLQLFTVAIGIMKALDFYARRKSPPKYANPNPPPNSIIALLLFTELRYESFTPNFLRTAPAPPQLEEDSVAEVIACSKEGQNGNHSKRNVKISVTKKRTIPYPRQRPNSPHYFSESFNLVIHATFFCILQIFFPQTNSTVLAVQILLAIYIIWESLQLVLRYKTSPPLFGPLYTASSLASFWSETWHTAFASPCRSLAYDPLRRQLPAKYGVPDAIAKAIGILASFSLMGLFHAYGLRPLLHMDGVLRIITFFLLNGIGTVIETFMWGKRAHWAKTVLAWAFELAIASWTVEGLCIPKGLQNISWHNMCDVNGFRND